MARGLPIVTTAVGGNSEVVDAGTTGLLAPARDPAALARAIVDALADPARITKRIRTLLQVLKDLLERLIVRTGPKP